MLKIEIQTDQNRRISLPVPYGSLNVIVSLASSRFIWKMADKWINKEKQFFSLLSMDPKMIKHFLKPIIKELKHHQGLVLVNVQSHDGQQVKIKL